MQHLRSDDAGLLLDQRIEREVALLTGNPQRGTPPQYSASKEAADELRSLLRSEGDDVDVGFDKISGKWGCTLHSKTRGTHSATGETETLAVCAAFLTRTSPRATWGESSLS